MSAVGHLQQLDVFLRASRTLGELYVDLYKDVKRVSLSAHDYWSLEAEQLQQWVWGLVTPRLTSRPRCHHQSRFV